jgi:hypothetical protein
MADFHKGEKYGKGLLIDSGEGMGEQREEEEQEANFDDFSRVDEEFVIGDYTPLLMIRRVCFMPRKVERDDGQCHNLFHTTCTIGGKACKLVIDEGNCENVVAKEVVQKLGLEMERSTLHYIAWSGSRKETR